MTILCIKPIQLPMSASVTTRALRRYEYLVGNRPQLIRFHSSNTKPNLVI